MNSDKLEIKNIERKNFFSKVSKGFAGLVLLSYFPFKLFASKDIKKVEIKINPQAVSRKSGLKNG